MPKHWRKCMTITTVTKNRTNAHFQIMFYRDSAVWLAFRIVRTAALHIKSIIIHMDTLCVPDCELVHTMHSFDIFLFISFSLFLSFAYVFCLFFPLFFCWWLFCALPHIFRLHYYHLPLVDRFSTTYMSTWMFWQRKKICIFTSRSESSVEIWQKKNGDTAYVSHI